MAAVRTPDPRHINLGSNYGATLPDPKKLLAGTGARVRHIKIALPEDLERPYLRNYLHAALQQAGRPASVDRPKVVIKGSYPTKRRPAKS